MADGLTITERTGFGFATIMARNGVDAARIGEILGVDAPQGPHWARRNNLLLIGTGPNMWMAYTESEDVQPFWGRMLQDRLAGIASVSDQSSGYSVVRLAGKHARTALQRGAAIDFHPQSFKTGSCAATSIAHIGVLIWQLDDAPTYDVATFRSFAGSFRHWLDVTASSL